MVDTNNQAVLRGRRSTAVHGDVGVTTYIIAIKREFRDGQQSAGDVIVAYLQRVTRLDGKVTERVVRLALDWGQ
jgi:hypothetical protein